MSSDEDIAKAFATIFDTVEGRAQKVGQMQSADNPHNKVGDPEKQAEMLRNLSAHFNKAPAFDRFKIGDLVMLDPNLSEHFSHRFPGPGFPCLVVDFDPKEYQQTVSTDTGMPVERKDLVVGLLLKSGKVTEWGSDTHFVMYTHDSRWFVPYAPSKAH